MRVSYLESIYAPPQTVETTWDALATALQTHREYPSKTAAPAWCPAVFSVPQRKKMYAVECSAWALDLDDTTQDAIALTHAALVRDSVEHVVVTTHSHLAGPSYGLRVRFAGPFARPVPAAAWATLYPALVRRYAPHADPSTYAGEAAGVERAWFVPSCPPGGLGRALAHRHHGRPLDPQALEGAAGPIPEVPSRHANREDLRALRSRWNRRGMATASVLRDAIDGLPLAIAGQRDTTVFRLVRDLVRDLPWATTESLVDLLTPSIAAQGSEPPLQTVADKIERARVEIHIPPPPKAQPTGTSLRTTPYTPSDLTRLPAPGSLLIHTREGELYAWHDGQYHRVADQRDRNAALRALLYPAEAAGWVSLTASDGKPRPVDLVISSVGRTDIEQVVYEYGAQSPRIEASPSNSMGPALILPTANAHHAPVYDPQCAHYLQALAPEAQAHHDLETWLMVARFLPLETLPALVLHGPRESGKTLFAHAVSRLWHDKGPTAMTEIIGAHQARLRHCPLVFADEQLPRDPRGRATSAAFRQHISERETVVDAKYRAPVTIRGATRWIFAFNRLSALHFNEALEEEEVLAIAERIRLLPTSYETVRTLRELDASHIVQALPGHVAALWAAHQAMIWERKRGRFWLGEHDDTALMQLLLSGDRGAVLQWIILWILEPSRLAMTGRRQLSYIKDGVPCVHPLDVYQAWDIYMDRSRRPTARSIGNALRTLAEKRTRNAEGQNHYQIDLAHAASWLRDAGLCSYDEVTQALARDPAQKIRLVRS